MCQLQGVLLLLNNEHMVTVVVDHAPAARGVPVATDPGCMRFREGRSDMMISHILVLF